MRGLRSFIGLVAILLGLGAYLYFVESKRTPGDEGEKRDKVFSVKADQIDEVSIKSESGERTTLKKADAGWQVTAPVTADADASEISGIISNLESLEQQRLIDENPGDLKKFGLDNPRIEVAFKAGGQEQRLLIGSKTPTGTDLYVKTGAQPRVLLVASYVESTFNRGTFDLRDKTALRFDRDTVDSLEIVTAERTVRFAKANGTWQLAQPAASRADAAAIESLLGRLSSLQMKKIAAPAASDLKQYGLDTPAATVKIGTGSSQATFLVGSKADEGDVYARDSARPAVFTVESTLLDDLKKDSGEYRQKDLFDARSFNTTRVEIVRAGETRVFERSGDKWRQTAPAAKDADAVKIEALLSTVTAARADSFVDTLPAGGKGEATVTIKFEEGRKEERVTFSRAGADAFAERSDAPGAAKIGASVLDGILKAIDEAR